MAGPRFFDAMTGPIWYINATAFGHADVLNENAQHASEVRTKKPILHTFLIKLIY